MPLYVADYLADTGHLSAAEHGAYMLLIMHYWTNGGLPADERRLSRIARMSDDEWANSRDELGAFFGDGWTHARIDAELAKSEEISSKRKAAAAHRHSKCNASASANADQMHTQSQPQSQDSSNELSKTRVKRAPSNEFDVEFDEFWATYPRRPGNPKDPAKRKFVTLRAAGVQKDALIDGARGYASFCVGKDPQFIALATTWLNNGRWKDDYAVPPRPPPQGIGRRPTIADRYANLINDEPDHDEPSHDGPTIEGSIAAIGYDASGRHEASRAPEPLGAEPGWPLAATGYSRAHN